MSLRRNQLLGLVALLLVGGCAFEHKSIGSDAVPTLTTAPPVPTIPTGWVVYRSPFHVAFPGDWEIQDLKSSKQLSSEAVKAGDSNMRTLLRDQVQRAPRENAEGYVALGTGPNGQLMAAVIYRQPPGRSDTLDKVMDEIKGSLGSNPLLLGAPNYQSFNLSGGRYGYAMAQLKDAMGQAGSIQEEFAALSKEWRYGALFVGFYGGASPIASGIVDTIREN